MSAYRDAAGDEAVFAGSREACAEAGLVLEARGLPYRAAAVDATWVLLTAPELAAAARAELERYALERNERPVRPPVFVPFAGAGLGAAIFAIVLVAVAYCAGVPLFGADWLAAGALDDRAGGAGEWWRAVTALTLHLDQEHLLGNLLFGAVFGAWAGRAFGPGVAWASILAAGGTANYLDMLIAPSGHRAAGASTAVFAALGLLSGFAWRQRLTVREQFRYRWAPVFGGISLLALLGAGGERVDVLGHALGFAMGLALGWTYARLGVPRSRGRAPQLAAGGAALALVLGAWLLALRHAAA